MKTLGIVGFGDFGQFMARHLAPHFAVTACNRSDKSAAAAALGVGYASHEEVAALDVVILAVPVQNLEQTLLRIAPHLRPGTLVADVASVKVRPFGILERLVPPEAEFVATHPMFGPQSGREGIAGLKIVLCGGRSARLDRVRAFLAKSLRLRVLEMTPEEHDRSIAYVQGLTHWISRAVRSLPLPDADVTTPAYERFLQIGEILRDDSLALFRTIERENPFAAEVRARFRQALDDAERLIDADED